MDTLSARGDTDTLSEEILTHCQLEESKETDTLSAAGVRRDWQILQSVSEIQSFTYHHSVNALYEQKISVLTFFYIKGEGQMQTRA